MREVSRRCQAVYDEVVALAPDLLPAETGAAMIARPEAEPSGAAVRTALIVAGAAAVMGGIGVGGYYAWRQSVTDASMDP